MFVAELFYDCDTLTKSKGTTPASSKERATDNKQPHKRIKRAHLEIEQNGLGVDARHRLELVLVTHLDAAFVRVDHLHPVVVLAELQHAHHALVVAHHSPQREHHVGEVRTHALQNQRDQRQVLEVGLLLRATVRHADPTRVRRLLHDLLRPLREGDHVLQLLATPHTTPPHPLVDVPDGLKAHARLRPVLRHRHVREAAEGVVQQRDARAQRLHVLHRSRVHEGDGYRSRRDTTHTDLAHDLGLLEVGVVLQREEHRRVVLHDGVQRRQRVGDRLALYALRHSGAGTERVVEQLPRDGHLNGVLVEGVKHLEKDLRFGGFELELGGFREETRLVRVKNPDEERGRISVNYSRTRSCPASPRSTF